MAGPRLGLEEATESTRTLWKMWELICFPVLASAALDMLKEEQNPVQAGFSPCPLLLCEISVSCSSSSQDFSLRLDQDCPPSGPISMSSLECSTKQQTPILTFTEYVPLGVLHRHLKFNIPNWAYHFLLFKNAPPMFPNLVIGMTCPILPRGRIQNLHSEDLTLNSESSYAQKPPSFTASLSLS